MYLSQALEHLENLENGFVVTCYAHNKFFVLCYVGDENGCFKYAFQPINKIAFYKFGIGESFPRKDGLKDYLIQCLRRGYRLYYSYTLIDALQRPKGVIALDPHLKKHKIKIDDKEIEISHESFLSIKKALV